MDANEPRAHPALCPVGGAPPSLQPTGTDVRHVCFLIYQQPNKPRARSNRPVASNTGPIRLDSVMNFACLNTAGQNVGGERETGARYLKVALGLSRKNSFKLRNSDKKLRRCQDGKITAIILLVIVLQKKKKKIENEFGRIYSTHVHVSKLT